MIRKLIILLLIVGCEKDTTSPKPEDCAGVAGGNAYLDECGFCVLYGTHTDHVCPECGDGYVLLWGECYNVEGTTKLFLQANQLTGEIPPEIENLTNLTHLYLYNNQLIGEIPAEIGNLVNLTALGLSGNQLTGEIPPEIGNLMNLTHLSLYNNQLTGEIPVEVCDLMESNILSISNITSGNNITKTCV